MKRTAARGGAAIVGIVAMVAAMGLSAPAHAMPSDKVSPRVLVKRGPWVGTSTNWDRNFDYGKVTFTVGAGVVRNFKVEGVSVSGCGNYMNIVVPQLTLKGRDITGTYQPYPDIAVVITVAARFAGGKIRGTFTQGPDCRGAGRFTASPA